MSETHRILIVDDEGEQAEMVREYLRLSGFTVTDRTSTIEGMWERLSSGSYDVILLDYKLPDGTGLDALDGITQRECQVPVVMVTGQGDERVAVQAIQRGAIDYLVKTGDYLATLPALIRKAVRAYELQQTVLGSLEKIRYQALLLNNVRDAVVVWDMNGQITYWNPAAAALYGWTPAERIGRQVEEVYLSVFTPPIQVPRGGETQGFYIERQHTLRNQQTIWVSSRITTLRDAEGGNRLIGYMDVSHDITKRKEAESALRAERNFVSAVLETVGALVIVLDRQGRIVRFNRACEQITGYSFQKVRGKYLWDLFLQPEEAAAVQRLFQDVQNGAFPASYEDFWHTPRGSRHWITWSNTVMTSRQGQIEFVIATGIDMTGRRQAEQALRESEARYRAMVEDYQTELICRFTPSGSLTFANEVYCRYFGRERDELLGSSFLQFVPTTDQEQLKEHLAGFDAGSPVAAIELRSELPGHETRWMQWTHRAIFNDSGGILEFQAVGRDVTDRKRAEEALKAAQTHLTQAARLATIGEMASGIAHQINNPLTTIIADAQLLMRRLPNRAPGRDSAEAIEQAGWRLQEVVQRLLEFSRPVSATLESLSINRTVERALLLVGAHIESVGVSVDVDLLPELPQVRGNSRQLEDLWVNLLLLARDAMEKRHSGSIRILSRTQDNEVLVEVWDDGEPIPLEKLASIFEPNFIGPTIGRGTGMELSICREIVRQHGGEISAESRPDGVNVFRVTLPVEPA